LSAAQLSRDFKSGVDTHHWAEVIERINSGEMPPESEPRPTQEEIAAFVTKLDTMLKEGALNENTLWHGFERIGSELSLSPSHVDRYYRAAELVLDRAFPAAPETGKRGREGQKGTRVV